MTQWSDTHAIFKAIENDDIIELKKCLYMNDTSNNNDINNNNDNNNNDNNSDINNDDYDSDRSTKKDSSNNISVDIDVKKVLELEKKKKKDKNILEILQLRDSSGLTPLLYSADRGMYQVFYRLNCSDD